MPEMVPLRDGPTVALDAIILACDLELRGFELRVAGDKLKLSAPETVRDTLTDQDRENIKKWKNHLLVVVSYVQERI